MAEWLKALVLKTKIPDKGIVGSNPTSHKNFNLLVKNMQITSLRTHWIDFLNKLGYIGLAYLITASICFYFRESLFWTLNTTFLAKESTLIFTSITEAFWTYVKFSLTVSVYLNVPSTAYFSWLYLVKSEYDYKNVLRLTRWLLLSQVTTMLGFVLLKKLGPILLYFFLEFSRGAQKPFNLILMPKFAEYLALLYQLAGGALLLIFLVTLLAFLATKLAQRLRPFNYLCLSLVIAVVAPPEPLLQLIIFVILITLYELVFYLFSFLKQINSLLDGGGIRTHDET